MVNLLIGQKGSGKTQKMIEQANAQAKECNGNVVFIKKTHRDTTSVSFDIRTICLDDLPAISNTDAYIGFLYGMSSANHDIECIFIDGILKHADITAENLPTFVAKLNNISAECNINFYVSVSGNKADFTGLENCNIIE
ncbi:MAG: hypothetical protein ACI4UH_04405 [Dorea sp.]